MPQEIETAKPSQLSGKRREAFKTIMQLTATQPRGIMTVYDHLQEIYKTKESAKKALKLFDQSPEIPIDIQSQQVKNTA